MSADYQEAIRVIKNAVRFGINPSLDGITALCQKLGNPQDSYPSIQVAGTNGKSSTSRYLAAILIAHGFKVGLYTSPELCEIEERIEVNGSVVSKSDFATAVINANNAAASMEAPTEFELITATALWMFAQAEVDFAVLEVGLGGRWDATSVVSPKVAVITGIDYDHTAILGSTIAEIAAEKAAIIKSGATAVLAPTKPEAMDVFLKQANAARAKSILVEKPVTPPQQTPYQQQNQATAITAAKEMLGNGFNIEQASIAIANTQIPGRFDRLRVEPLILIDAAHNPQSATYLATALTQSGLLSLKPVLLLAILKDKDVTGIIQAIAPLFDRILATRTASDRALEPPELAEAVLEVTGKKPTVFASTDAALSYLIDQNLPFVATGSITLAGEVKRLLTMNRCSDKISR